MLMLISVGVKNIIVGNSIFGESSQNRVLNHFSIHYPTQPVNKKCNCKISDEQNGNLCRYLQLWLLDA